MKKVTFSTQTITHFLAAWLIFMLTSLSLMGQTKEKIKWYKMGSNHNVTFYDVQKDFNKQWQGKLREMAREKRRGQIEEKEEGGLEVYKRWEAFMAPRVYPSGNMSLPSSTYQKFMDWKQNYAASKRVTSTLSTGNWTELGPIGSPSGPPGDAYTRTGAGRVNFIRFNPTNSSIIYVGTPDGGLWKSTNGGTTWTTNTDFLTIIGCSDLAIDPTNPQIMYLATGDIENDRRSIGILKSTNGGATWNATGLAFTATDNIKISKLLMNPADPLNMIVSTSGGTFSTTNGWTTFATGSFAGGTVTPDLKDMEFKPSDFNTLYAAGTEVWKSVDKGDNWTQVTTGLPSSSDISRIALAVSPANAAYVYALIGKASDQSFLGLYRSTNSGASFSLRSSKPNLLGYETDGSDSAAGQAFYDLAVVVSPTNADVVTTGGVNHWQSVNGGTTWTNKSYWAAGQVHADVHEINYLPGSSTVLFSCNDGGIFKSIDNGANWTDVSHNLAIAQVVGIGLSANVATAIVAGEQDNGTNYKAVSSWTNISGGDGGDCFIDYSNNSTIYFQYVNGAFSRSDDAGVSSNTITTGLPTGFDFYSKWHQDPVAPNTIYTGGIPTLYRSINKGDNWAARGTPPGTGTITDFAVAPSNNTVIYAIKQDAVSKSTNSGASFIDITGTLPVANASLSSIVVSATSPNKVWVTFSGYSAGEKVYKSIDGGTSWTNLSAGLPNIPVNIVVFQKSNANDAIYVGADIGVFYLDNTLASFTPFMTALPNAAVRDLEIYYPSAKLRAATYGRGVWESDLNNVTYTFTGNGNWSSAASWLNNNPPATILPNGAEIVIDPAINGKCDLDIPYTIPAGTKLTIKPNAKFIVHGNLIIN